MTYRVRRSIWALAGTALTWCAVIAASVTVAAGRSAARPASAAITEAQAEQIGTDAYVYGIPLMDFVRQERTQTSVTVPNTLSDAPINQFGNARQLASASRQVFVQPNLDTLYSMAHIDLRRGPQVLRVPAVPDHRYYEMQFLDPYTNVFHYVGTRATGDGAGTYVITGPSFRGSLPHGLIRIRSAYQHIWIAGRTAVYGPNDIPRVHKTQDGFRLIPLAQYRRHGLSWHPFRPRRIITNHTQYVIPSGVAFFDALGSAMAQDPPPAADAKILRELRTVGIGPGLHPSAEHLSAAVLAGLKAAADKGPSYMFTLRTQVAAKSVVAHHGWFVPYADTASFGTDYKFRAVISVYGLAANRPIEAMYIVGALDSSLTAMSGAHDYRIHFAAGHLPPARYFWSITLYDSSFYLIPNSINRYSIGDRTPNLARNADGSLDIYVQRTPPAGHQSNWLPAPAGAFNLTLRMYGPRQSALDDTYVYPPIMRTG